MAIDIREITEKQRLSILSKREGHFFDGKAIEVRPSKVSEAIAAFANTDGGELFVGLDQDKNLGTFSWRGFKDVEAANAHIQVFDGLFPLGQDFQYTFLSLPGGGGLVLHIEVRKTRDIKRATDTQCTRSRSASALHLRPSLFHRLEADRFLGLFAPDLLQ